LPRSAANYTVAGTVSGDALNIDVTGIAGSYAASNVGIGINVTVTTPPTVIATRAGIPVFGYAVAAVQDIPIGTINPATLALTASDQRKTYGETLSLGTTAFSAGPLFGSDSVTGVTLSSGGVADSAAAGGYAIAPSAPIGNGLSNYSISFINGTLTVNPATLTLTPSGLVENSCAAPSLGTP